VFALANAGVAVSLGGVAHPIASAVMVGLVAGKPLGIVLASWLVIRLRLAKLPDATSWNALVGAGCLGGIGFTMALFLNTLAFPVAHSPADEAAGKIGTLAGSVVSAALGSLVLASALRR